ncbi:MAG: DEAD/DEAH box helicase [Simkaniaceae bacterium]|nr:DEAD/DEAH box helicase [Simkaniaceae bacterium]
MTFDELNLHPQILKAVNESGYTVPTPIQEQAIPKIIEGADLRASAQTGTGKTAAFLLPALNRLVTPSDKSGKGPRVVILVPTRELAQQISGQAEKYSKYLGQIKTVCVVGGVPYHLQERKLARPCDILIATPGRLIDYIDQRKINFSRLEMVVLDEADRMLDMGFVEPVKGIVRAMPNTRQTLLFSATMEGSVIKLSEELLNNPEAVVVNSKKQKHENIEQKLHRIDNIGHKNRLLNHILDTEAMNNVIVFTSTKRQADTLAYDLKDAGYAAAPLHGDMSQRQRTRTIKLLKDGKFQILIATDVAARGIDIDSISHVINFDLPQVAEDYVHRIGRTGRAGATGIAISFAGNRDSHLVRKIEQYTGQQIAEFSIEGMEATQQSRRSDGDFKKKSFGGPRKGGFGRRDNASSSRREGGFGRREGGFGRRDSNPDRREGGFARKEGSFGRREGGPDRREGGFARKEGSFGRKEGGFARKEGSFARKEGSPDRKEGSFGRKEGGFGKKPGGFAKKDGFKKGGFGKKSNFGNKPRRQTSNRSV